MRKFILLLVFIPLTTLLNAQSKRALIIGIGQYPDQSGWAKIHGDNDIDIICSFLIANGFLEENIIIMKNEQATKSNIIRQFKKITELSKVNDFIYIHFSGHGQQVTDIDGDEEDGFDEAWIPYNAKKLYIKNVYEGENHLIDDEVNIYLQNIKSKIGKNGQLLVVVDACSSGDSSRGDDEGNSEEIMIRGTQDRFIIENINRVPKKERNSILWIEISACKSFQNNHECTINGKNYGSLSYSLYANCLNFANVSLLTIENMLNKNITELISGFPQNVHIDNPASLSNQILFKK